MKFLQTLYKISQQALFKKHYNGYWNVIASRYSSSIPSTQHSYISSTSTESTLKKSETITEASRKPKEARLLIGFTCKVCKTRSHKFMSKNAYEKGVVIIKCDGCSNKHLIADHLGWFDTTKKSPGTIEDILKEKGETVQRIKFDSDFELQNNNTDEANTQFKKETLKDLFANASLKDLQEIEQGLLEYLPSSSFAK